MELFGTLLQCCHDYHEFNKGLQSNIKDLETQIRQLNNQFQEAKDENKSLEENLRDSQDRLLECRNEKDDFQESTNEIMGRLQSDRQAS